MTVSTLSPKNQTTLSIEFVRRLKLKAGTRFQQTIQDGKIILEPIPDVMTAYGGIKIQAQVRLPSKQRVAARKKPSGRPWLREAEYSREIRLFG